MAGLDWANFKPLEFQFAQVHVRGGHAGKFQPMNTRVVSSQESSVEETFVKMAFTEPWLIFLTTGQHRYTGSSFGRTTLLNDLRTRVEKFCDGEAETEEQGAGEDYDPMAEIDGADSPGGPQGTKVAGVKGVKRARYYKNHCKNTVVTASLPARSPEEDPNCTDVRKLKLFIEDRKKVWLHLDDVPWAVRYLYGQNMLKGVPLVSPDSAGPGGA